MTVENVGCQQLCCPSYIVPVTLVEALASRRLPRVPSVEMVSLWVILLLVVLSASVVALATNP